MVVHACDPSKHLGDGGRKIRSWSLSYMRQKGWEDNPWLFILLGLFYPIFRATVVIWHLCPKLLEYTEVHLVLLRADTYNTTQTQHRLCACQRDKQPLLHEVLSVELAANGQSLFCGRLTSVTPREEHGISPQGVWGIGTIFACFSEIQQLDGTNSLFTTSNNLSVWALWVEPQV